MAHKKSQGSTALGRDSISKRLGVKLYAGETANPGAIIIRQKGTKFHPGENVAMGKDYTLFSKIKGRVYFVKKRFSKIGRRQIKTMVGVR
ncbi:50S ribosomal protein L27 [Patescibacteria group bacterium]|nr:50S ribosomal protein L27 [Patescibacteria group bacterium]